MNTSLTPEQRAALLLPQMTLEEKAALMVGDPGPYAYFNAGIPRLGIPDLKMADGGAGVSPRGWTLPATEDRATSMPSGVAMAATWDPQAVRQYATVVGNETKATGHNILLGPNVDIVRQPWWGRVSETMSEDPLLTSKLVVPYVQTVQSGKLIANLKHYNLYTQETNRAAGQNVLADERTVQEVYTPPWQAAIQKADLGSVMCSFNKYIGVYACENPYLLNTVLRQQLGFRGFVLSDFGAIHSTVPSITAGADMETGTASFYGQPLVQAVQNGQVSESLIDTSVRRILTTMFRFGLFDTDYTPTAINVAADGAVAQAVEEQAITLLKNSDRSLPLNPRRVDSIAVIGGDADTVASQGGAPRVLPTYTVTPLEGIRKRAGTGVNVTFNEGADPTSATSMLPGFAGVPSSVLSPAQGSGNGLRAEFFTGTDFTGPISSRVDRTVNFDLGLLTSIFYGLNPSQLPPPPATARSVRYTGTITAPRTGTYSFDLTGWGDARMWLDGKLLVDMTGQSGLRTVTSPQIQLVAGQAHDLRVDFAATSPLNDLDPGSIKLGWTHPQAALTPAMVQAASAARRADVAIVVARTHENEQRDRASLTLPNDQNQLISAVAAANPNTIVVLTTGGPVTMPWLGQVRGVVQTYFGGQEVGDALARVLYGDVNPSGKLPITYPRSEEAVPDGVNNPYDTFTEPNVTFGEGPLVGYQAYLKDGIRPLFAFGHGLSYTKFDIKAAKLRKTTLGPSDSSVAVSVQVRNVGKVSGSEVVQVYVGNLPTNLVTAPRRLAGFAKIQLAPGQTGNATISIDRQSLSYWSSSQDQWVTPTGKVSVFVGSASDDLKRVGQVTLR